MVIQRDPELSLPRTEQMNFPWVRPSSDLNDNYASCQIMQSPTLAIEERCATDDEYRKDDGVGVNVAQDLDDSIEG
jgi:hypothetical protein